MFTHSPRAFPLGVTAPVGTLHSTQSHSRLPRARRPRPRICLRNGCRRQYLPRRWNQRYCQDPECLREVRRWQAARRQAQRRRDIRVKAQHAQAEKERRQRAKVAPKTLENPDVAPARGRNPLRERPPPTAARDRLRGHNLVDCIPALTHAASFCWTSTE